MNAVTRAAPSYAGAVTAVEPPTERGRRLGIRNMLTNSEGAVHGRAGTGIRERGTLLRVGRLGQSSAPAPSREDRMLRTIFAVAISGLVLAAISGASQATPIAPLPAGVVSDVAAGNVTKVHACGWRCRQLHRSHRWYYQHHPH